jgi:hypothetical protein
MSDAAPAHRLRDKVFKAPSAIHGNGVFARIKILRGQYIGSYSGPSARRNGVYVLWVYGEDDEPPQGRSGRNLLRWLNHQKDANSAFDGFDLYAIKDIEPGEEITFNYSGADDADIEW